MALLCQQASSERRLPLGGFQSMKPGAESFHHRLQHGVLAKPPPILPRQRRQIPLAVAQRDPESHPGSHPGLALQRQAAPHLLGQLVTDGEPEPGPAETPGDVRLDLLERGKQVGLFVLGDADPRVLDDERQPMVVIIDPDVYLPRLGEFHRIVKQVRDHLSDPNSIDAGLIRHLGPPGQGHAEPLAMGQGGMATDDIADDGGEPAHLIMQLQLARLHLGEVQDVVDQVEQVIGGGRDVAQHIALVVVQIAHLQQLQHAVHAGDGGTQFMAHGREETTAGLHRLLCHRTSLTQLQRLSLQAGDILHHPIQDDPLEPLLMGEVPPDLQVAKFTIASYFHFKIQGLHRPGMLSNGLNEVVTCRSRQP
ncbi:hypothetical protein D3C79_610030 [compost metagenome]